MLGVFFILGFVLGVRGIERVRYSFVFWFIGWWKRGVWSEIMDNNFIKWDEDDFYIGV